MQYYRKRSYFRRKFACFRLSTIYLHRMYLSKMHQDVALKNCDGSFTGWFALLRPGRCCCRLCYCQVSLSSCVIMWVGHGSIVFCLHVNGKSCGGCDILGHMLIYILTEFMENCLYARVVATCYNILGASMSKFHTVELLDQLRVCVFVCIVHHAV